MFIAISSFIIVYTGFSLFLTYLVHRFPRKPVPDSPDWGKVLDARIPAHKGGQLEVWKVSPAGTSRGTVILAHGWGRNRGRMVARARIFGSMGFTTVMHSARDHGESTPYPFMNAVRFAEDIESVMNWVNEPVLLYGHSAGAAGATIAAHRNPDKIRLLFLEGCYPRTSEALISLYKSVNPVFGLLFARVIVFWMRVFYGKGMNQISPANLAPDIDRPVLLIHGEKDQSFPLPYALRLRDRFPAGRAELFVAHGSDHSSSSLDPRYPEAVRRFTERHLGT
jgi:pimeloyl-ACP methyl ester carboxylesterase